MNPMTFLFVVVIIITICAFLHLCNGFKRIVVERETILVQFVVYVGIAIWGWLIYFN